MYMKKIVKIPLMRCMFHILHDQFLMKKRNWKSLIALMMNYFNSKKKERKKNTLHLYYLSLQ